MDPTDAKILSQLKKNARVNASVIGQEVNMSVSAVIERIRKLEKRGVIRQYTVLLDYQKIGKDITTLLFLKTAPSRAEKHIPLDVADMPNVVECCGVTGDFDFMLKIVASSIQETSMCISRITNLPYVMSVKSNIVLSSVKNEDSLLLEECI